MMIYEGSGGRGRGVAERAVCGVAGVSLIGLGLRRGGVVGWSAAAAGGLLAWHGVTGLGAAYGAAGIGSDEAGDERTGGRASGGSVRESVVSSTGISAEGRQRKGSDFGRGGLTGVDGLGGGRRDLVDQASEDSFPASDPPSYTGVTAAPEHERPSRG